MQVGNVPILLWALYSWETNKFVKELGYSEFWGSSIWLENFKERLGIVGNAMFGENYDMNNDVS